MKDEGIIYEDFFSTRPPEAVSKEEVEGLVSLAPAQGITDQIVTPDKNPTMFCSFCGYDLSRGLKTSIFSVGGEHE